MTSHTPGPWQSHDDQTTEGFVTIIGNVDGEHHHDGPSYTYDVIARCEDEYGERLPNVAANVRLICAAPDLVEALQWALRELGGQNRYDEDVADEQENNCYARARAALAKAGVA